MSDSSYTYTTITARRGEPTRIGVSFYLGEHVRIRLYGAGTDRPHLGISQGEAWVSIAARTHGLTAVDAAIARKLADQAALYATEIERLCAATNPGTAAA